ncbi:hypothetical protein [Paraburkholderia sp. A3RO-2L]|uniref:hypothetical protein n=1 Tax=unclassified Paraburkholderia TaxID=2615204 RepID=UPI003DA809F8
MHLIPAYETAITLFSRDGAVWTYPSLKAALKALGARWIQDNVGPHFRVFDHAERRLDQARNVWVREPLYRDYLFIMRDDFGGVVTSAEFAPLIQRRRWRPYWYRLTDTWNGEGPVPGVRKYRGGRHYYRHPQTMPEIRQNALVLDEEGEVRARPRRGSHYLPSCWDDRCVAARRDRSWKRHRKNRWKE